MKAIAGLFVLIAYLATPMIAMFLKGYGGHERLYINFFMLFFASLAVLVLYTVYLCVRWIDNRIHNKGNKKGISRIVLSSCILLYLIFVVPRFSGCLKKWGAETRLKKLGGDAFCGQLLKDASVLCAYDPVDGHYVPYDRMPESFQRLGGEHARFLTGSNAFVDIQTSGRPTCTGWILVPENSSAGMMGVKITEHISRY